MTSKEARSLIGYTANVNGKDLAIVSAHKLKQWMFRLSDGSIRKLSELR